VLVFTVEPQTAEVITSVFEKGSVKREGTKLQDSVLSSVLGIHRGLGTHPL
jgi:hypothetical protein